MTRHKIKVLGPRNIIYIYIYYSRFKMIMILIINSHSLLSDSVSVILKSEHSQCFIIMYGKFGH